MNVLSVSVAPNANSFVSAVVGNTTAPAVSAPNPSANQQPSASVTLSAQGQSLSQATANQPQAVQPQTSQPQASQPQTSQPQVGQFQVGQSQTNQSQANQTQSLNTVNTPANPNVVPQSSATTAAPGIQFMSGESKGGRVNTYA